MKGVCGGNGGELSSVSFISSGKSGDGENVAAAKWRRK
jgi:hypothetical protein